MHVIQLRVHLEVTQSVCNLVIVIHDIDLVVNNPTGMSNPLPTHHKLVFRVVSEGIRHPTVPTCDTYSGLDSIQQSLLLFLLDGAHGPDRHHQAELTHLVRIQI